MSKNIDRFKENNKNKYISMKDDDYEDNYQNQYLKTTQIIDQNNQQLEECGIKINLEKIEERAPEEEESCISSVTFSKERMMKNLKYQKRITILKKILKYKNILHYYITKWKKNLNNVSVKKRLKKIKKKKKIKNNKYNIGDALIINGEIDNNTIETKNIKNNIKNENIYNEKIKEFLKFFIQFGKSKKSLFKKYFDLWRKYSINNNIINNNNDDYNDYNIINKNNFNKGIQRKELKLPIKEEINPKQNKGKKKIFKIGQTNNNIILSFEKPEKSINIKNEKNEDKNEINDIKEIKNNFLKDNKSINNEIENLSPTKSKNNEKPKIRKVIKKKKKKIKKNNFNELKKVIEKINNNKLIKKHFDKWLNNLYNIQNLNNSKLTTNISNNQLRNFYENANKQNENYQNNLNQLKISNENQNKYLTEKPKKKRKKINLEGNSKALNDKEKHNESIQNKEYLFYDDNIDNIQNNIINKKQLVLPIYLNNYEPKEEYNINNNFFIGNFDYNNFKKEEINKISKNGSINTEEQPIEIKQKKYLNKNIPEVNEQIFRFIKLSKPIKEIEDKQNGNLEVRFPEEYVEYDTEITRYPSEVTETITTRIISEDNGNENNNSNTSLDEIILQNKKKKNGIEENIPQEESDKNEYNLNSYKNENKDDINKNINNNSKNKKKNIKKTNIIIKENEVPKVVKKRSTEYNYYSKQDIFDKNIEKEKELTNLMNNDELLLNGNDDEIITINLNHFNINNFSPIKINNLFEKDIKQINQINQVNASIPQKEKMSMDSTNSNKNSKKLIKKYKKGMHLLRIVIRNRKKRNKKNFVPELKLKYYFETWIKKSFPNGIKSFGNKRKIFKYY